MKNETLERLRLPGAWVLVGAVGASMLSGLIHLATGSLYPGTFHGAMGGASGAFFGLQVPLLLAVAVALVLTGERTRQAASPIVLTGMIMSGLGLFFAAINLITGFVSAAQNNGVAPGFVNFVSTLGSAAVLGLLGFALLKAFGDPTLVPRPVQQQYQYPPQQYPPATGAQQSFAQPAYPAHAPGPQVAADPAQTGSGAHQGYDPAQQQGYDASQQYGQQYGTDAAQQQYGTGAQQGYAAQSYDAAQQYGTDASGQQQAYAAQQAAYDPAQQQGYDASQQYGQQYGTDAAQQQYGTGAQQGYAAQSYDAAPQQQADYGQAYDPSQYAPQGAEQQPAAGEQAAQDAIQYGWYQGPEQPRTGQDTPSEGGVDQFFNSGENNTGDTSGQGGGSYGGQYGSGAGYGSDQQGQGGTGGQQGWYGSEDKR